MKNNKKSLLTIILVAVLAVVIIAAAAISQNGMDFNNKHRVTDKQDNSSISQSLTDESVNQQNSDNTYSNETTQTADNNNAQTDNVSDKTTIESAMDTALKNSGIAKESLIYLSAHQERNKNTTYYEVTFSDSSYEYEYEIDLNANIISYEKEPFEPKDNSKRVITADSGYIGVENAKNTALNDSAISMQDINYTKITLERDNGIYIYDVEFKTSETKYEYEIDATSGKIIDQSLNAVKK